MQKLDLTGQRFGSLTVLHEAERRSGTCWLCRCDCGNSCVVLASNLRRGHSTSCGCTRMRDLTGQRFGKLTVLCRSERRAPRGARTTPMWECRCDCGAVVYQSTDVLTNGDPHMCVRCRELYCTERAREKAGFVDGTQLTKLRDMTPTASNTSGVRGVIWEKSSRKWRARLKYKGKLMNFGSYERFEDAVAARKQAEAEYFGTALAQYGPSGLGDDQRAH